MHKNHFILLWILCIPLKLLSVELPWNPNWPVLEHGIKMCVRDCDWARLSWDENAEKIQLIQGFCDGSGQCSFFSRVGVCWQVLDLRVTCTDDSVVLQQIFYPHDYTRKHNGHPTTLPNQPDRPAAIGGRMSFCTYRALNSTAIYAESDSERIFLGVNPGVVHHQLAFDARGLCLRLGQHTFSLVPNTEEVLAKGRLFFGPTGSPFFVGCEARRAFSVKSVLNLYLFKMLSVSQDVVGWRLVYTSIGRITRNNALFLEQDTGHITASTSAMGLTLSAKTCTQSVRTDGQPFDLLQIVLHPANRPYVRLGWQFRVCAVIREMPNAKDLTIFVHREKLQNMTYLASLKDVLQRLQNLDDPDSQGELAATREKIKRLTEETNMANRTEVLGQWRIHNQSFNSAALWAMALQEKKGGLLYAIGDNVELEWHFKQSSNEAVAWLYNRVNRNDRVLRLESERSDFSFQSTKLHYTIEGLTCARVVMDAMDSQGTLPGVSLLNVNVDHALCRIHVLDEDPPIWLYYRVKPNTGDFFQLLVWASAGTAEDRSNMITVPLSRYEQETHQMNFCFSKASGALVLKLTPSVVLGIFSSQQSGMLLLSLSAGGLKQPLCAFVRLNGAFVRTSVYPLLVDFRLFRGSAVTFWEADDGLYMQSNNTVQHGSVDLKRQVQIFKNDQKVTMSWELCQGEPGSIMGCAVNVPIGQNILQYLYYQTKNKIMNFLAQGTVRWNAATQFVERIAPDVVNQVLPCVVNNPASTFDPQKDLFKADGPLMFKEVAQGFSLVLEAGSQTIVFGPHASSHHSMNINVLSAHFENGSQVDVCAVDPFVCSADDEMNVQCAN